MDEAVILKLVKFDLQKLNNSEDEYLLFLIRAAKKRLEGMKISFEENSFELQNLLVHYAAYLYRKRGAQETALPLFIRQEINDIKISQVGESDDI